MCGQREQVAEETEKAKDWEIKQKWGEGEDEVEDEERNPKDKYLLQRQIPRCLLPPRRPH